MIGINQATVSRLRSNTPHNSNCMSMPRVSDTHLLALYDATGMSIEQLRGKLYLKEFTKPLLTPHEIIQRRLKAENEVMAEKQRRYRESIKNDPTRKDSKASHNDTPRLFTAGAD